MHELTVAARIRAALDGEFEPDDGDVVIEIVRVQVGALTGIVPEALEFAWPHAVTDSRLLASSTIQIEVVEPRVRCRPCGTTTSVPHLRSLRCPTCRSPEVSIIGGDELELVSVDVAAPRHSSPSSPSSSDGWPANGGPR